MVRLICSLLYILLAASLALDVTCCFAESNLPESIGQCNKATWLLSGAELRNLDEFFHRIDKPWGSDKQFRLNFRALVRAYPSQIRGVEFNKGKLWILMRSGERILYDDGIKKNTEEKMRSPDLEDTLSIPYKLNIPLYVKDPDYDPGRIRNDAFFKAVYGSSASEVKRNLVVVDFCGNKVRFNRMNGAAKSLEKVSNKLCPQVTKNPAMKSYVNKLGGTFNWRKIAGTERMSAHSYGIAIDLNPKNGAYWRWYGGQLSDFNRKDFPRQVITAFEEQGFIWGGKWYHFDLMHFEYRPELLDMILNSQGLVGFSKVER